MITEYLPYAACLCGGVLAGAGFISWGAASSVADAQGEADELRARIQTLTDIARSQQSIKSGRIIDVLEG